jgi:hypothetical protein
VANQVYRKGNAVDEMEKIFKENSMAYLTYYTNIFLERLRKTTKTSNRIISVLNEI